MSILVTGANGGLGTAVAAHLFSHPSSTSPYPVSHAVFAVRSPASAASLDAAVSRKHPESKLEHRTLALDLSRLASVREAAAQVNGLVARGELPPLRALVWNAGYQEHTTQTFSEDGFDMTFQANYLGHWLFTLLVLQSMDRERGRIVIVGSWMHDPHDDRNASTGQYASEEWKTIFHDSESLARGTWSSPRDDASWGGGLRRYGASKLCEVMTIRELQARLDSDPALSSISVLGIDPGGMPSTLSRRGGFVVRVILMQILMPLLAALATFVSPNGSLRTTTKSARDILRAALDEREVGVRPKGVYLNGTDPLTPSAEARDAEKTARLWRDSIGYAGLKEGDTVLVDYK